MKAFTMMRSARLERLSLLSTYNKTATIPCGASFLKRHASTTSPKLSPVALAEKQTEFIQPLKSSALSILPLSVVLRSYMVMSLSSSPILLSVATKILKAIVHAKGPVLNVDRNPLLHWFLKRTFYAQFCAGENKNEVSKCIEGLQRMGYSGVVLEYAMEVLSDSTKDQAGIEKDIQAWKHGLLDTVDMVNDGDFIAFKYDLVVLNS